MNQVEAKNNIFHTVMQLIFIETESTQTRVYSFLNTVLIQHMEIPPATCMLKIHQNMSFFFMDMLSYITCIYQL